jgi:general secretion pathway protein J
MRCDGPQGALDTGGEAGFTLVELLVALALFSLLVTLLFDNVRLGLQAWRHSGQYAEDVGRRAGVQDTLRRLVGNLYPMAVADGSGVQRTDFEGGKDRITFLSGAPTALGSGGRFRYAVSVEREQDRTNLVLRASPELVDPKDASAATKTVLLPDIAQAEFSYFGDVPTDRQQKWQDAWSRRADIPKLIRVHVVFAPGDAGAWPDLLIAPRILADVGCIYDPATMRCRGR